MIDNTPIKQRLQITFGKFDALIYISNLDVAKLWERVLRRADLPVLYSEGFNPRPRIALASALPLGISSECEVLDVAMRASISLDGLVERLLATSPSGLRIYRVDEVPVRSPTLQTLVRSSEYRIELDEDVDRPALEKRIAQLLQQTKVILMRERKGQAVPTDVRPLIHDVKLDSNGDLLAHLAVGDQGNLRPDELGTLLELGDAVVSVHRFRLHIDRP
jgi:radical SAM-linked protein